MKIIRLDKPTITALRESDRVSDFRNKSDKRFFATISGFVDKYFFTNDEGLYDEKAHQRYNERNTNSLLSYLKRLGFEYQKITGIWAGDIEKSFLVWNTAYTWEQFQQIMLKLNELFKQWGICIGRKVENKYEIDLWETHSLDDIEYKISKTFTAVTIVDAIQQSGTLLTRKIYDRNGKVSHNKVKRAIVFEELQRNVCAAASHGSVGFYTRRQLIRELLEYGSEFLVKSQD